MSRKWRRGISELDEPPTAVFVANNLMALDSSQALRQAGALMVDGIALTSFDDVSWFGFLPCPITAIAQPTNELRVAAARRLPRMEEKEKLIAVILEAEMVLCGSCGEGGGGT